MAAWARADTAITDVPWHLLTIGTLYLLGARSGAALMMIRGFIVKLFQLSNLALGVLLMIAGIEPCPLIRSLIADEEYFVALEA